MNKKQVFDQAGATAISVAREFLRYSLDDVGYEYDSLTPAERRLCSREDFDHMVKWFRLEQGARRRAGRRR